jgi:hypothetical protein
VTVSERHATSLRNRTTYFASHGTSKFNVAGQAVARTVHRTVSARCTQWDRGFDATGTHVPRPQGDGGSELLQRDTGHIGGGDGIRTHDLYIANVALCQLSYTPDGMLTLPVCW